MIGDFPTADTKPSEMPASVHSPVEPLTGPGWTAELSLLAACCRWPPPPKHDSLIRRYASDAIDWDRFARTVRRHRTPVLAAEGLRRAGLPVPADTLAYATETASHSLRLAGEALRLQRAFDGAGISAFFVKGSTLAMLAYGDLGKKHSADTDLVTSPDEAMAACALLRRLGYVLFHPPLNDDQFARYVAFEKESTFRHPTLGLSVDLHWRLTDNQRLLSGVDASTGLQEVKVATGAVRTLADEPLFAYLCVHGTLHSWARLKWLADVAAFLGRRSEREITHLYQVAIASGAGRAPTVALLLCQDLFGLRLEPILTLALREDRIARRLAMSALTCLAEGAGVVEPSRYSPTGLRLALSHFRVAPGRRYALSQLNRVFTSGWDRAVVPLPRPLGFLYYLLRAPSFVARLVLRHHRQRSQDRG